MSSTIQGVTASQLLPMGSDVSGFAPAALIFPGSGTGTITGVQFRGTTTPGAGAPVTLYNGTTRLATFSASATGLNISSSGPLTAVSNTSGSVFVTFG